MKKLNRRFSRLWERAYKLEPVTIQTSWYVHKSRIARGVFFKFYVRDNCKTCDGAEVFLKIWQKISERFMRMCLASLRVSRLWVSIYRMVQKSPDVRINVVNFKGQVTSTSSCTYLSVRKNCADVWSIKLDFKYFIFK